jgi:hypothetical protein
MGTILVGNRLQPWKAVMQHPALISYAEPLQLLEAALGPLHDLEFVPNLSRYRNLTLRRHQHYLVYQRRP